MGASGNSRLSCTGLCVLLAVAGLCWHWIRFGGDGWFYLATGRWIWENQALPQSNVFAFTTPLQGWSEQKWLACLALYIMDSVAGHQGALAALSLVAACALGLCWASAARRSASPVLSAALVFLGFFVIRWRLTARGETFGMLLLAAVLYAVERHRARGGGLGVLWIAPITGLWANLHGSFYLGALIPAAVLASEALKRVFRIDGGVLDAGGLRTLGLAAFLAVAAMGAHPMGYGVVGQVLWQLGALHREVDIWGPLDLHSTPDLWAGIYMGVVWLGLLGSREKVDWADLVLLLPMGFEAVLSRRFVDPFVLVSLPAAARHWASLLGRLAGVLNGAPLRRGMSAGMAGLGCAMLIIPASEHLPIPRQAEGAVEHLLAQEVRGNLFNYYTWGGYIIWRGYPSLKVFIDGRDELYTNGVFEDYLHVMDARPGWEEILDMYEIEWVLLPNEQGIVTSLREDHRWEVAYEDAGAILMRRKGARG